MSATNRGSEREAADFYPTPAWCVDRLVEACPSVRVGDILEPCAGDGAIIRALRLPPAQITAVELREEAREHLSPIARNVHIVDFLRWADHVALDFDGLPGTKPFDIAITNPPYDLAMEVIESCWPIAKRLVMLLRLNFLGSAERQPWLAVHPPTEVHVLPNRPSFVRGKTDNCEYAWIIWDTDREPERQRVGVLGLTPKAERICARR